MTTICKKRGAPRQSLADRIGRRRLRESGELYLIMLPVLVMIFIFFYMPMFGVVIAFQDYVPGDPFFAFDGSTKWVGLQHFKTFFSSIYFPRLLKNTLTLSLMNLAFGFWVPIAFALLLNEVTHLRYKKLVQTASYMPYFISMVLVGLFSYALFNVDNGLINTVLRSLGLQDYNFYLNANAWPPIIIAFQVWKGLGYGSIIYLSVISGIETDYYEAARIDGATKWQQIRYLTLPMLKPTFMLLFMFNLGSILKGQFQLFYQLIGDNGLLYSTTDIIDTYVYRALTVNFDIGMGSAAGVFQSVFGFVLVITVNAIVRKLNKEYALF